MVVSSRHLHHRQNLRGASNESNEDFADEPQAPSLRSGAALAALTDEGSKLARFLFVGEEGSDGSGGSEEATWSWFSNFRRIGAGDDDMPSLRSWDAGFMALALEPMEVRNERIIMLFEAYAIFGALLLNGGWIVYEYGSWKGYGGNDSNAVAERVFECLMAVALGGNVLLALWGALFWINAVNMNSSHRDYAFEAIKPLAFLQYLLMFTAMVLFVGMLLGMYINLSPHLPETIVALAATQITMTAGFFLFYRLYLACAPLESYHFPAWIKYTNPHYWFRQERSRVKCQAKLRAHELKKRACCERRKIDPSFRRGSASSVAAILHKAAKNLGRPDCNIFAYDYRLAEDWFSEASDLKDANVEFLSRYMPYRLAAEVHKLVKAEYSG